MPRQADTKSLRILLLIKSLEHGGAERQCCMLASQLDHAGHEVCVVVYQNSNAFYATLLPDTVQLVALNKQRWNIPNLLIALYKQMALFKPDLAYSFLSHSNLVLLLLRPFTNVKTICGIRSSGYIMNSESLLSRLGERLHRWAIRYSDLIIVNSHAAKSELAGIGLHETQVAVVANGIDVERFTFRPECRTDVRNSLAYAVNNRVIGMFARHHPMKGYAILLEAFIAAAMYDLDLRLLLIGSVANTGMRQRIAASGFEKRITVLDTQCDIERYYSAIDVYCSASLYGEGFSNSLAEAMATGLYCITTDVGDSARIVGGFGEVIAASNIPQLAEAIRNAPFSRELNAASVRRAHIADNFGIMHLAERTIATIQPVLGP